MNKDQVITYAVAFKGAIRLASAGVAGFETQDVVAEVIELTDAFYEAIASRQGLNASVGVAAAPLAASPMPVPTSTPSRFSTSPPQASAPAGSTNKAPKDPGAAASPAQIGFLKKLIRENKVPSDDAGFELKGVVYNYDEFTMGSIQVPIEELK